MVRLENRLEGVERAGADVPEDNAERPSVRAAAPAVAFGETLPEEGTKTSAGEPTPRAGYRLDRPLYPQPPIQKPIVCEMLPVSSPCRRTPAWTSRRSPSTSTSSRSRVKSPLTKDGSGHFDEATGAMNMDLSLADPRR